MAHTDNYPVAVAHTCAAWFSWIILPVKAPVAARAAATIDAARTLPVEGPPMMAPWATPDAAPWPTGVSHDISMQQLTAMTKLTARNVVRIICF
jgi:hypothetical protein